MDYEHAAWTQDEQNKLNQAFRPKKPSHFLKGFLAVIISALVLSTAAAYYIYTRPQNPDVSLEVSNVGWVHQGQPFSLLISYSNNSDKILSGAKISLLIPEGVSFAGASADQRVLEQDLGDIGPGIVSTTPPFNLVVTSGSQTIKHVEARLTYSLQNKAFNASAAYDVSVGQPAVQLSFSTPDKVYAGENFNLAVNYQNTTDKDLSNLQLALSYPNGFQVASTSIAANGNSTWNISSLPKNGSGTLVIAGSLPMNGQQSFAFGSTMNETVQGAAINLGTQTTTVALSEAPLALSIQANNDPNYVTKAGDSVQYVLTYKNNSSVPLQNVNIAANLIGELFDFGTITSDGTFNSLKNTVTWDPSNKPELALVAPGQEGTMQVAVRLKTGFPIRRVSDKNYYVRIRGTISSPTVPPDITASQTLSMTSLDTKVAGQLSFRTTGLFYDAPSGILNSGPYPPRANKPTRYTIHWILTNYSTDVSNITVTASLQSGTTFTGTAKSNTDSVPVYNADSHQVQWTLKLLPATKGVLSKPAEAIFQVENTPATTQAGQNVPLVGQSTLTGTDMFTGQTISMTAQGVDTSLPDDVRALTIQTRQVQP